MSEHKHPFQESSSTADHKAASPGQPAKTKADGNCAFHAVLGVWNEQEQQFVCKDAVTQRKIVQRVIAESKAGSRVRELTVAGVKELILSGRAIGVESQKLLLAHQRFLADQNALSPDLWRTFETKLWQHLDLIAYIIEHHEHPQGESASFRNKFYDTLNRNGGKLYELIRSIPALDDAFKLYNELDGTGYDWNSISIAVIHEYAAFVGTDLRWLLPLEVEILAWALHTRIVFYTASNATPDIFNPTQSSTVTIQFDGQNHFERIPSPLPPVIAKDPPASPHLESERVEDQKKAKITPAEKPDDKFLEEDSLSSMPGERKQNRAKSVEDKQEAPYLISAPKMAQPSVVTELERLDSKIDIDAEIKRLAIPLVNGAVAWNQQGREFDQKKEYPKAMLCYKKAAVNLHMPLFNISILYGRFSKFEKALAYCDLALIGNKKMPLYYNQKGQWLLKLNRYKEAIGCFNTALYYSKKDGPENHRYYNNLGLSYFALGDYDKAKENYTKAYALQKDNIFILVNIIELRETLGNAKKVSQHRSHVLSAFKTPPVDPSELIKYSFFLLTGDEPQIQQALKNFAAALAINAYDIVAWVGQGRAYLKLNKPMQAHHSFSKAVEISPWLDACLGMADSLKAAGKYDQARKQYKPLFDNYENRIDIRIGYGEALLGLNKTQSALDIFDSVLARYTWHFKAMLCRARALQKSGRSLEALRCREKACVENPEHPLKAEADKLIQADGLIKKADAHFVKKEYQEALDHYAKALEIQDDHDYCLEKSLLAAGNIKNQSGDFPQAFLFFFKVIQIALPDNEHTQKARAKLKEIRKKLTAQEGEQLAKQLNLQGNQSMEKMEYQRALGYYEMALSFDANNAVYLGNRGIALRYLDRYQEAAVCYEEAAKNDPENPAYPDYQGKMLYKLSQFKKARNCFRAAKKLDPKNPVYHNNQGEADYQLTNLESALRCFRKAQHLDPANPYYIANEISVLERQGKFSAAFSRCLEALENNPDDKTLLEWHHYFCNGLSSDSILQCQLEHIKKHINTIKKIDLSGLPLKEEFIAVLCDILQQSPCLIALYLNKTELTDAWLNRLVEALAHNHTLQDLCFDENPKLSEASGAKEKIAAFRYRNSLLKQRGITALQLHALDLREGILDHGDLRTILECHTTLSHIDFSAKALTCGSWVLQPENLTYYCTLTDLNLSANQLGKREHQQEPLKALIHMAADPFNSLKTLNLSYNGIDIIGLWGIMDGIIESPGIRLTSINLSGNLICTRDAKTDIDSFLGKLKGMGEWSKIELSANNLSKEWDAYLDLPIPPESLSAPEAAITPPNPLVTKSRAIFFSQPTRIPSIINPEKMITAKEWLVFLAAVNTEKNWTKLWKEHAMLVVEGMRPSGQRFLQKFHLIRAADNKAQIKVESYYSIEMVGKDKLDEKTGKPKVIFNEGHRIFVEQFEKVLLPLTPGTFVEYSLLGGKNCLGWCRKQLEALGIVLPADIFQVLQRPLTAVLSSQPAQKPPG